MINRDLKILFVDDEPNILSTLRRLFLDEEYELLTADSGEKGLAVLEENFPVQVVVSDYRMPGMNGVDFLKQVHERWPDTVRIVLSGYADTAAIVSAINEGKIYKFIPKPWNDDELKVTIAKAADVYFLKKENEMLTLELTASNEELKTLNENLEDAVRERTAELLFQNQVLQHSQVILDSLPFAVMGIDRSNVIVQCNRKCREIFGGQGQTLLGQPVETGLAGPLPPFIEKVKEDNRVKEQLDFNGRKVEAIGSSFQSPDGQQGVILTFREGNDG